VQDFKKKFNITSTAMAAHPPPRGASRTPGQLIMERHHESLINTSFAIYNTYLAPSSSSELNIDYVLRSDLHKFLEEVVTGLTGKPFQGQVEPEQAASFNATQLHTMIRHYERIQVHVFRLMATDSVPKFITTPKFLDMRGLLDDLDGGDNEVQLPTGAGPWSQSGRSPSEEEGRAYVTVSARGSERQHKEISSSGHSMTELPSS